MSTLLVGRPIAWHLLAGGLGVLVGMAELMARYRDEPFRTIWRRYGLAYLLVNGLTSFTVSLLISHWKDQIFPGLDFLAVALSSGFGAMAILRSKFFTFRTKSNDEIPIGFDAIVRALLSAIDRGVDRAQSDERWYRTYAYLADVSSEDALKSLFGFLAANLSSYQNVSPDERQAFDKTLEGLIQTSSAVSVGLRAVSAGLAFQIIAGNSNFEQVATEFRRSQKLSVVEIRRSWPWLRRKSGG